jgi:NAD(P)-dependent dehydrogenase (short-subunit alcohol dehydrogenase family)
VTQYELDMPLDFSARRVVITGGANGIGRAAAEYFVRAQARVVLLDLPRENPSAIAASFGAKGLDVDVTDSAAMARIFDASGPPDILLVNAGIAGFAPLAETSDELWQRSLDVNLTGAFHALRAAVPLMKARRRGAIVITASTNSYDGEPNLSAYNATKAALLALVRTLAGELGPWRIRVNAVCPGLIRTRLTESLYADEAQSRAYFREIPLGRGGEAEEVARAIAFLASDEASFITGTTLVVDGGQMATKFGPWNDQLGVFVKDHWELKP